jgi:hypothetical protein
MSFETRQSLHNLDDVVNRALPVPIRSFVQACRIAFQIFDIEFEVICLTGVAIAFMADLFEIGGKASHTSFEHAYSSFQSFDLIRFLHRIIIRKYIVVFYRKVLPGIPTHFRTLTIDSIGRCAGITVRFWYKLAMLAIAAGKIGCPIFPLL